MKLVIVAAVGAIWAVAGAGAALCQTADPAAGEELGETPSLRGDAEESGESAETAAPSAEDAEAPAAASPEVVLAEAKSAAQAEAAASGATDPLVENVADYALFQRDLAAIDSRSIAEPQDLDAIMDTLAGYTGSVLSDAYLSYAAFLAAQDPEFVGHVREVSDYYGLDQLLQGMINEPKYVLTFPGAKPAAAVALSALREDAAYMKEAGDRLKQESYDLQTRGWSNMIAHDRDARLAVLNDPKRITTPGQELLADVSYGAPIESGDSAQTATMRRAAFWSAFEHSEAPPAPAPMTRADENTEALGVVMTLAALRALDVSAARPDLVEHLLDVPSAKDCLDFALLHLRQCVAAAHFKYEDAFCIAEHQLFDASRCLGDTVGGGRKATPIPPGSVTLGNMTAETTETTEETVTAGAN